MKCTQLLVLLWAGMVSVGGCWKVQVAPSRPLNTVEADGFAVSVEVPKRAFAVGETFPLTVTARNTTSEPIEIVAASGAPVYVRVMRYTGLVWEKVKQYPESATMVITPWTLEGKSERLFTLQLTVQPDWPTAEPLRLEAFVNGRPDVFPTVNVEVIPPSETAPR